jgi:hypothetical protein
MWDPRTNLLVKTADDVQDDPLELSKHVEYR